MICAISPLLFGECDVEWKADRERDRRKPGCCLLSEASKTGYSVLEIHLLCGALCLIIHPTVRGILCLYAGDTGKVEHIQDLRLLPPADSRPLLYD